VKVTPGRAVVGGGGVVGTTVEEVHFLTKASEALLPSELLYLIEVGISTYQRLRSIATALHFLVFLQAANAWSLIRYLAIDLPLNINPLPILLPMVHVHTIFGLLAVVVVGGAVVTTTDFEVHFFT